MKFSRLIWHVIDRSSNSNRSGGERRETHEPSRGDVTVDGTVHKVHKIQWRENFWANLLTRAQRPRLDGPIIFMVRETTVAVRSEKLMI